MRNKAISSAIINLQVRVAMIGLGFVIFNKLVHGLPNIYMLNYKFIQKCLHIIQVSSLIFAFKNLVV